jgi:hypothetical protein
MVAQHFWDRRLDCDEVFVIHQVVRASRRVRFRVLYTCGFIILPAKYNLWLCHVLVIGEMQRPETALQVDSLRLAGKPTGALVRTGGGAIDPARSG